MTKKQVYGLIAIVSIVPLLMWGAYCTSTIWNWLAVPILGAPDLTIAEAFALGLVVNCFTWGIVRSREVRKLVDDNEDSRFFTTIAEPFFAPAFLLGVSWIVKEWFL